MRMVRRRMPALVLQVAASASSNPKRVYATMTAAMCAQGLPSLTHYHFFHIKKKCFSFVMILQV